MEARRCMKLTVTKREFAEAIIKELNQYGSKKSFLTIRAITSSFCLGDKEIAVIITDDTKYLKDKRRDCLKWVQEGLKNRKELLNEIEEVADIVFSRPQEE